MDGIKYGRKKKGIKKALRQKVNDWLSSINDDDVKKEAEKNIIVTGGSIASMLLGESVNDFDIYFKTKESALMIAKYYVDEFNKDNDIKVADNVSPFTPEVRTEKLKNIKGKEEERVIVYCKSAGLAAEGQATYEYFESEPEYATDEFISSTQTEKDGKPYRPVFLSQNAITLSDKVQLIIRFYGEAEKIHSNYDFSHAMCSFDYAEDKLNLPSEALECLLSRTLLYRGSLYPIASIFRMKKFIERGWRITAGQQLKIMWQISEIDLADYEVIREQLTGVDQAYLYQLIESLKNVDPEKINSAYVSEVIDRIFD